MKKAIIYLDQTDHEECEEAILRLVNEPVVSTQGFKIKTTMKGILITADRASTIKACYALLKFWGYFTGGILWDKEN